MAKPGGVDIVELVPWSDTLTAYDEAHLSLYLRLLDGRQAGLSDVALCRTILALEPDERGRAVLDGHMRRADWMTQQGFRQLLRR